MFIIPISLQLINLRGDAGQIRRLLQALQDRGVLNIYRDQPIDGTARSAEALQEQTIVG